jgi:hypothetical protein
MFFNLFSTKKAVRILGVLTASFPEKLKCINGVKMQVQVYPFMSHRLLNY